MMRDADHNSLVLINNAISNISNMSKMLETNAEKFFVDYPDFKTFKSYSEKTVPVIAKLLKSMLKERMEVIETNEGEVRVVVKASFNDLAKKIGYFSSSSMKIPMDKMYNTVVESGVGQRHIVLTEKMSQPNLVNNLYHDTIPDHINLISGYSSQGNKVVQPVNTKNDIDIIDVLHELRGIKELLSNQTNKSNIDKEQIKSIVKEMLDSYSEKIVEETVKYLK